MRERDPSPVWMDRERTDLLFAVLQRRGGLGACLPLRPRLRLHGLDEGMSARTLRRNAELPQRLAGHDVPHGDVVAGGNYEATSVGTKADVGIGIVALLAWLQLSHLLASRELPQRRRSIHATERREPLVDAHGDGVHHHSAAAEETANDLTGRQVPKLRRAVVHSCKCATAAAQDREVAHA